MSAVPSSFTATSLDRRIQMLRTAMGPLIAAALEDPDVVEIMLTHYPVTRGCPCACREESRRDGHTSAARKPRHPASVRRRIRRSVSFRVQGSDLSSEQ